MWHVSVVHGHVGFDGVISLHDLEVFSVVIVFTINLVLANCPCGWVLPYLLLFIML